MAARGDQKRNSDGVHDTTGWFKDTKEVIAARLVEKYTQEGWFASLDKSLPEPIEAGDYGTPTPDESTECESRPPSATSGTNCANWSFGSVVDSHSVDHHVCLSQDLHRNPLQVH